MFFGLPALDQDRRLAGTWNQGGSGVHKEHMTKVWMLVWAYADKMSGISVISVAIKGV